MDISCFENRVDSNQLASEKPADRVQTVFHPAWKYMDMLITGILQGNGIKIRRECSA